jgi:hypothetical protein
LISEDAWVAVSGFFNSRDKFKSSRVYIWEHVKELGAKAGIKHLVFPHALRATAATEIAVKPNVTTEGVKSVMGWSKIKTADIYVKATGEQIMRMFGKVDPPKQPTGERVARKELNQICKSCGAGIGVTKDGLCLDCRLSKLAEEC